MARFFRFIYTKLGAPPEGERVPTKVTSLKLLLAGRCIHTRIRCNTPRQLEAAAAAQLHMSRAAVTCEHLRQRRNPKQPTM